MSKKKITDLIDEIVKDFLDENDLELYNTEFLKEGKDWFLRVYIDKKEQQEEIYVSTDDCEKVSRYLSEALDRIDPKMCIRDRYSNHRISEKSYREVVNFFTMFKKRKRVRY